MRLRHIPALVLTSVAALSLLTSAAAQAQQAQSSTNSTAFDNWELTCATRTDKDNKTVRGCEVRTTIVVQDEKTKQAGVAALLAIGQTAGSSTLTAAVQVPISAALKVPVKLTGSDGQPIVELTYAACQAQVCQATATITPEQLTALKGVGEKLTLVYDNLAGQTVKIDTNTKGMAAALDALAKEALAGK
jgi:invasion protein IalB